MQSALYAGVGAAGTVQFRIDGYDKNGQPVPSPAPISSQIKRWRASFGHNMLTANYMHRWFPFNDSESREGAVASHHAIIPR